CPNCLGRFLHDIHNCILELLWDGSHARCSKDANGTLINPKGQPVCTQWQRPFGCRLKHSSTLHECSGCGNSDHGAQMCPRAQKKL
ncbi:hypothetical protein EV363DRAFT_1180255, partial [Boletus edulis]